MVAKAQPGWYPDPRDPARLRWWDGSTWDSRVSANGLVMLDTLPPTRGGPRGVESRRRGGRIDAGLRWLCGAAALAVVVVLCATAPSTMVGVAIVAAAVCAAVLLLRAISDRLRVRAKLAGGVMAVAIGVLVVSTGIGAATATSAPRLPVVAGEPLASPTASATLPPSEATAIPTVLTHRETVTETLPFRTVEVTDSSLPAGESRIIQAGVVGHLTRTYVVTVSDGQEIDRRVESESVTQQPVDEIRSIGTLQAPAPAPATDVDPVRTAQESAQGDDAGCDGNYADGCVPVAVDVDCAGTGNGPAYFSGSARVVGRDVYTLDDDGDGLTCN